MHSVAWGTRIFFLAILALLTLASAAEAAPRLDVRAAQAAPEGGQATFEVTLRPKAGRKPVTVNYKTLPGTAGAADFSPKDGTLKFKRGDRRKKVQVVLTDDALDENAETFSLKLSNARRARLGERSALGTITDDDPLPALAVNDPAAAAEGDGSFTGVTFAVTLSAPSGREVRVDFDTQNGTAVAPGDYVAQAGGSLTFSPGNVSKNVFVAVNPDRLDEADETFSLNLSNPQHATITGGTGTATIIDDDAATLNETGVAAEADFCNIQTPATMTAAALDTLDPIYGRLFEAGVTEAAGPGTGVLVHFGIGPEDTDPRTALGWRFHGGSYNVQVGETDEYQAVGQAPITPGTYSYVFRFSVDNGVGFTYCDLNGAGSNDGFDFDDQQLGTLTVTP